MCVFLSLSIGKAQIKKQFDLRDVSDDLFGQHFVQSAYEFKPWPVISCDRPELVTPMNWGLIPRWVKDSDHALKIRSGTVNARIETVEDKASFRQSVKDRRCLVIADGFYEFREVNQQKYPYFIRLRGQEAFALAGLFDEWTDRSSGEVVQSFSILTTEANPLMEKIHNRKKRMPVILSSGQEREWLNFENKPLDFRDPYPAELMEAWTVSRLITSRKENRNVPRAKEHFEYPELHLVDGLNI